ncbi:RNA-binding protein Puf1 [Babesia caballi]|uniref:RNA-binding protein Puf1 n=1 Tax=Babesia caballi TaxID=5871 RepID=A0AAV4LXX9_BABCB|nr:RNA-binding protein Puf1 [Babesia caballi]
MKNVNVSAAYDDVHFGAVNQCDGARVQAGNSGSNESPYERYQKNLVENERAMALSSNLNALESDTTMRHADYMGAFQTFEALAHDHNSNKVFPAQDSLRIFDDYEQCDSFSTRYSDAMHDTDQKSSSAMMVKFDTLKESVLKQLETPLMEPQQHNFGDNDMRKIGDIDPKIVERLCNAGINVSALVSPKPQRNPEGAAPAYSRSFNDYEDVVNNAVSYKGGYPPHLDLNSNLSEIVYCNEDGALDLKKDFNNASKSQRVSRRKQRKAEENRGPQFVRAQSEASAVKYITPNVSNVQSNKSKSMVKGYYANVAPSWFKSAVLDSKADGHVTAIAKDQAGCRMLQKLLESNDEQLVDTVLQGVLENLVELMMDPFGNYLCQKLMTVCCERRLSLIVDTAGNSLIDVALNTHGTRALQKLIEIIRAPEQVRKVTDVLKKDVVRLVTDLNGNHVIQKCLSSLPSEDCEFIYDEMIKNCVSFATHRHGCCVMQRCIDAANERQLRELVEAITVNTLHLVEDAYGNYVIQYTLKLNNNDINLRIVKALAPRVTSYAKQKFSSNVVERCLTICPPEITYLIIERFVKASFDALKDLILHPFGNYVVQRVLNVAQPRELAMLLERIQPHLEEFKGGAAGKRIALKLSRRQGNDVNPGQSDLYRNGNPKIDLGRLQGVKPNSPMVNRSGRDAGGDSQRNMHRMRMHRSASPMGVVQSTDAKAHSHSLQNYRTDFVDALGMKSTCSGYSPGAMYQSRSVQPSGLDAALGQSPVTTGSLEMLDALFARTLSVGSDPSLLADYFSPGYRSDARHNN